MGKEKKEDEKKNSLKNTIKNLSNKVKIAIGIGVLVVLLAIGYSFTTKLNTKEEVLDFGFENVGELVTQEWYGRMLEDSSKDRKIFKNVHIPFTESRLIFSIDVEILAGLNFEDIEYDVSMKDKTITIKLPHSKIYKAYEVQDSFISYLDEESIFTNISSEEQAKMKYNVVEKGKEQAVASGLLDKADKNAKSIIEYMIKGNELAKDFKVEFKYKK